MKLEHIGIAVSNLEKSEKLFEDLLNTTVYKREEVASQSVLTSFLRVENTKLELLKSTDPDGPVSKYLEKFGEGIHHIAFEVDDLEEEIIRLRDLGYRLIDETPQKGADHKWVVFLHPNSTNKVLIELCQEIGDDDAI